MVGGLDAFRDRPGAEPRHVRQHTHRTSRVVFRSTHPIFPIRAARDKADSLATTLAHLDQDLDPRSPFFPLQTIPLPECADEQTHFFRRGGHPS